MISDLSVIVISVSVILLCWAVVRLNQKIDETIRNPKSESTLDAWSEAREPAPRSSKPAAYSETN